MKQEAEFVSEFDKLTAIERPAVAPPPAPPSVQEIDWPPLEPCPLCAAPAHWDAKSGDWGYTPSTLGISCHDCGLSLPRRTTDEYSRRRGNYSIEKRVAKQLAKRWNTRRTT